LIFGTLIMVPFTVSLSSSTPDLLIEIPIALLECFIIFFLDGLFVVVGPALIFFVALGGGGMFGGGIIILLASISIIANWLYHAIAESSERQATIGMRKFGLKLLSNANGRVSFFRASLRHFSKIISTAALFLGFAQVLWTPGGRALHDAISGTLVADSADSEAQGKEFNRLGLGEWLLALFGSGVLALGFALPISYDSPYRTMDSAEEASRQHNDVKAEQLYLKALRQAEKFDRTTERLIFRRNGDAVAETLGELAKFYASQNKFAQAEQVNQRLHQFKKSIGSK
jgi:uncharacterized RDD family membrane protein YckC